MKRLFFTLLITIIAFTGVTACGGNGGGDDSGKGSVIIKAKAVEKDPMKSMMFSMDYSDLPYAGAPISHIDAVGFGITPTITFMNIEEDDVYEWYFLGGINSSNSTYTPDGMLPLYMDEENPISLPLSSWTRWKNATTGDETIEESLLETFKVEYIIIDFAGMEPTLGSILNVYGKDLSENNIFLPSVKFNSSGVVPVSYEEADAGADYIHPYMPNKYKSYVKSAIKSNNTKTNRNTRVFYSPYVNAKMEFKTTASGGADVISFDSSDAGVLDAIKNDMRAYGQVKGMIDWTLIILPISGFSSDKTAPVINVETALNTAGAGTVEIDMQNIVKGYDSSNKLIDFSKVGDPTSNQLDPVVTFNPAIFQ